MKNLYDLAGKEILVTGASSGIGRQTAITLSEAGAKVILTARREEQLKETFKLLAGEGHAYYLFDLCNLEEMDQFMHKLVDQHGSLQGLAFCAGISVLRPYKMTTSEVLQRMMLTNFFSFFELVRQFAKKKYSDEGAKIVVVSSTASIRPGKGQGAYAASKAAVESSVYVLAQELLSRNININFVRPGMVDTPMTEGLSEGERNYGMGKQALGFISPKDVACLIAYLLSPAADMITGRGFDIDGGRICRE